MMRAAALPVLMALLIGGTAAAVDDSPAADPERAATIGELLALIDAERRNLEAVRERRAEVEAELEALRSRLRGLEEEVDQRATRIRKLEDESGAANSD